MTYEPPIGSFFTVRTKGWMAWLIRWACRSKRREGHPAVNHAGVYVGDGWVVEAEPSGAVKRRLSEYDGLYLNWHEYDAPGVAQAALELQGRGYGYLDILYVGLLQFHIRFNWLKERIEDTSRLICSQLVDLAFQMDGRQLFDDGRWNGDVTPQDLDNLPRAA